MSTAVVNNTDSSVLPFVKQAREFGAIQALKDVGIASEDLAKQASALGSLQALRDFGIDAEDLEKEANFARRLTGELAEEAGRFSQSLDDLRSVPDDIVQYLRSNVDAVNRGARPGYAGDAFRVSSRGTDVLNPMETAYYNLRFSRDPALRREAEKLISAEIQSASKLYPNSGISRPGRFNIGRDNRAITPEQFAYMELNPSMIVRHPTAGIDVPLANLTQGELKLLQVRAQQAVQPQRAIQNQAILNRSSATTPVQTTPQPTGINNPNAQMDLLSYKAPPAKVQMRGQPKSQQPVTNPSGNTQPTNPASGTNLTNPTQPTPTAPNTQPSFGSRFGVPLTVGGLAAGAAGAGGYMYGSRNQDRPFRNVIRHYTGF